ncbi:MAG: hypothetical protein ACW98Y_13455 [Candidatus Thorarchaeota archaeon]
MKSFASFFKQKHSEVRHQRKMIKEAVIGGANTVAKISDSTDLPEDLVLWNIMALLKWGELEVTGHEHHEVMYALREV